MLYDRGAYAAPGSRLESVLMVVAHRRQQQKLYEVRAIVQGVLAPHKEDTKDLRRALARHAEAVLPYIEDTTEKDEAKKKKQLDSWVGRGPMKIRAVGSTKRKGQVAIDRALEEGRMQSALRKRRQMVEAKTRGTR